MKISKLSISGAYLAELDIHQDDRGKFYEWFRRDKVEQETKFSFPVMQANTSISNRGVIRGIHYSLHPQGQAKWITCTQGSILDVIVDIRPNSPTYRHYITVELNALQGLAIFIESGLGHAFLSLDENTIVSYLLSSPYSPNHEYEINPMDPDLDIKWDLEGLGLKHPVISLKDFQAPSLIIQEVSGLLPFLAD
jgi:dTDP-4-dehydrorhamnose 3,5-epimerase